MQLRIFLIILCSFSFGVYGSNFPVRILHKVPSELKSSIYKLSESIDITIIDGQWNSKQVLRRFARVKEIFSQCHVGVSLNSLNEVRWLYSADGLYYDLNDNFENRYFDGTQQFLADLDRPSSKRIQAIFFDRFDEYIDKRATSFPAIGIDNNSIALNTLWITNRVNETEYLDKEPDNYSVFAHEIGHLLLNDFHEFGEKPNLMHSKIEMLNDQLTAKQCERIRNNMRLKKILNNHIEHFSEYVDKVNVEKKQTPMNPKLKEAIKKINELPIAKDIFNYVLDSNSTIKFVEVSAQTDPDMAVAFRVGFEESDQNTIFYTSDLELWKQKSLLFKPEIPGEEISTSTMGSLILHEFGHTAFGRESLGLGPDIVTDTKSREKSELTATRLFENEYRNFYNLPLRTSYFRLNDIYN